MTRPPQHSHRTRIDDFPSITINGPRAVTYDFHSSAPSVILTVPTTSSWDSLTYWHYTDSACEHLLIPSRPDHEGCRAMLLRSANLHFAETYRLGHHHPRYPPQEKTIRPLDRVFWKPFSNRGDQGHDLVAVIRSVDPSCAQRLYRNVAGVTVDAEKYPLMENTPRFVGFVHGRLAVMPQLQLLFAKVLLWVQLCLVFYENDFWVVWWMPNLWWLWYKRERGKPAWVSVLEANISTAVSIGILWTTAKLAKVVFGMHSEYEDYMPSSKIG